MNYKIYDTCPVLADKMIKNELNKEVKKNGGYVSTNEQIERIDQIGRIWNSLRGEYVESKICCDSINIKSNRKPARCKQCPLGIQNEGRTYSEITTIIEYKTEITFL